MSSFGKRLEGDPKSSVFRASDPKLTQNAKRAAFKAAFHALYEAMNGITLQDMDQIVYPVCTLCRNHQKSGFIEGIRIGVLLCTELTKEEYK